MAGRFVQNQNGRVLQECPRDGDPLALPAGEAGAALADHGFETVRQGYGERAEGGVVERRGKFCLARRRPRDRHIRAERIVEEICVLRDQRDTAAQIVELVVAKIHAVERNAPRVRVPEPHQQLRRRGLARARGPDQRHCLPGRDRHRHIAEREAVLARIGKTHAVEGKARLCLAVLLSARPVFHRHRLVLQRIVAPGGAERVRKAPADLRDFRDRQERRHGEQGQQR